MDHNFTGNASRLERAWTQRGVESIQKIFVVTNANSVNHLKIVGMILHESLRLQPPSNNLYYS